MPLDQHAVHLDFWVKADNVPRLTAVPIDLLQTRVQLTTDGHILYNVPIVVLRRRNDWVNMRITQGPSNTFQQMDLEGRGFDHQQSRFAAALLLQRPLRVQ